jgi:hypothetical protein
MTLDLAAAYGDDFWICQSVGKGSLPTTIAVQGAGKHVHRAPRQRNEDDARSTAFFSSGPNGAIATQNNKYIDAALYQSRYRGINLVTVNALCRNDLRTSAVENSDQQGFRIYIAAST